MTPSRAAAIHLVEVWRGFPVGTPVRVNNWPRPTTTASEPWVSDDHAVIRVNSPAGPVEVSLSCVHLAGPRAVTVADAIKPAPSEAQLAWADRPTAVIVASILFFLSLGAVIAAHAALDASRPPAWLCEEVGVGCDWREGGR